MAKQKPLFAIERIVSELGYVVDPIAHSHIPARLYPDLTLVPEHLCEKTRREYEGHTRRPQRRHVLTNPRSDLFELNLHYNAVLIRENAKTGYFRFSVDVNPIPGLSIPLLLSQDDVSQMLSVAKFRPQERNGSVGLLRKFPLEIRRIIYAFALPGGVYESTAYLDFDNIWLRGLGDPNGFYYPLASKLGLLSVNRQIREEILPLAYAATKFHFDDMDYVVKFLLAIGRLGRENVKTLDFPWTSASDSEHRWDLFPNSDDNYLALPSLHVGKCVQLLRQCKNLSLLRLQFPEEVLLDMSGDNFKADPGIRGLCSLHRIPKVEICSLGEERILGCDLAIWLKRKLEKNS